MSYVNYDYVVDQLRDAGLEIDLPLELAKNEKSVRCRISGGDHEKRGWYRLYEHLIDNDLYLVGSYGAFQGDDAGTRKIELTRRCDKCGASVPLRDKQCPACGSKKIRKAELSEEQKAALAARLAADKKRAAAERQAEQDRASQWASAVWRASKPVEQPDDHDYLPRKGLKSGGGARIFPGNDGVNLVDAAREDHEYLNSFNGALVVPIMDTTGRVFSLQFILSRKHHGERIRRTERDKEYWPGGDGTIKGHYFLIGPSPAGVVLIAEGFATGLTLAQVTGLPVAVAYAANNIGPVAGVLKKHYRKAKQLICADDDWLQKCAECKAWTPVADSACSACGKPHRKLNAGVQRASEAALVTGAAWIKPEFSNPRPVDRKGPTDFNDLSELEGEAIVRAQLEKALAALKVAPNSAAVPEKTARESAVSQGGGERIPAVAVMMLDDIVERFIDIDDNTGDFVFDTWTNEVCKRTKMVKMLPAGVRGDDIKRHWRWLQKGAVYIDQIGFDPGGEDSNILCNRWRGWPTKPKRGNCDNLLDLLRFMCSEQDNAEEVFEWIIKWLAYPIQHPGAKMQTALIVHGPQGTGKSRFFEAYAKIYGEYGIVINQAAIEDKFNADWCERKLFVVADEIVARAEMYHLKNQLKNFITGEWVRINPKNVAAHRERNHMNIVFLSNERLAQVLDGDDRRHCVVWTPEKMNEVFYNEVTEEINQGGIEALHDYLLSVDLAGFKPWSKPPMTEAKENLIKLSAGSDEIFLQEWRDGNVEGLPFAPAGTALVYAEYLAWCKRNGEPYPRPAKHFWATAGKPGWNIGRPDRYVDLHSSTTISWRCVIPPEELLKRYADKAVLPREGISRTRWLTDCYFHVEDARQKAGLK
jgi:putative DNA primase/helicase